MEKALGQRKGPSRKTLQIQVNNCFENISLNELSSSSFNKFIMKLLLLATLFFSHFAFSQTPPEDWRLTPRQAKAMIQYYGDCRGDCFTSTARADTAKENFVRALYPNAKSFSWVNARYRSDDVSRYASRNWELARTGGANVAGYTT
ncbi:MAG: hypothetical protein EOO53_21125, partial [Gammaproteobacteria bacterium]